MPALPRTLARIAAGLAVALLVAACGSPVASTCSATPACGTTPTGTTGALTKLNVGLGYIPNVQFAPFYLAQQNGSYRAAGLDVTFENKVDPDLITLTGSGAMDLSVADGTDVIPAVSQGIPIQYIATLYGTYPSIVFAKASSGIKTAADLKGRKIGIPGKYGSSWIMLQALLHSVGLTPNDVTILEYPDYGQGAAVQQGAVDAATGFSNNEPLQLQQAGIPVVVLHVDNVVALPGPGLIASTATLTSKHDAIAAFVAATLRAMKDVAATPSVGMAASASALPIASADVATQNAVLAATIATWSSPSGGAFGTIDHAGWQASIDYMTTLGLVPNKVTVDQLVRDDFLPAGS